MSMRATVALAVDVVAVRARLVAAQPAREVEGRVASCPSGSKIDRRIAAS